MATGIIGALTSGTLIYTAPIDAKLVVSIAGGTNNYPITINGISAVNFGSSTNITLSHFVGAGQIVNISVPSGTFCIVSVLEGS